MKNIFEIGDKVKVVNKHGIHYNEEGIVVAVGCRETTGYNYIVRISEYFLCQPMFYEKELIKIL